LSAEASPQTPLGGAYSAPPGSLTVFRGPTSKRRRRGKRGEVREGRGKEGEGREEGRGEERRRGGRAREFVLCVGRKKFSAYGKNYGSHAHTVV